MNKIELRTDLQCFLAALSVKGRIHEKLANLLIAIRRMHNTKMYIRATGQAPNYIHPTSYSEKMQCRKLFDRNPLFRIFCDKLEARTYAENADCGLKFTEIYWQGDDPDQMPFDHLPVPCIVKPNHRSGDFFVMHDMTQANISETRRLCRQWLERPFGLDICEWGYHDVTRRVYMEELLPAPEGMLYPDDYKLLFLSGRCDHIRHVHAKDIDGSYITHFDPNWQRLNSRKWLGWKNAGFRDTQNLQFVPRPKMLDRMIEIGEHLAKDLDMLRVDLYEIDGDVYFGELTVYDGSGFTYNFPEKASYEFYPPRDLDYQLGAKWQQQDLSLSKKLLHAYFS